VADQDPAAIWWDRVDALSAPQRQKWAASRVWTARQAPYLASAVLALDPVVVGRSASQGSAAGGEPDGFDLSAFPTDLAWHVYLDPEVVDAAGVPEIGFWLLHQVTHLLRHHADRYPGPKAETPAPAPPMSGHDPGQRRWNAAADAEIDDDLNTDQLELPGQAVTPARLGLPDGWLAEQYWDALRDPQSRALPELPPDASDCGTGADGQGRPWNCGRGGLSATGRKLLERDVARRIREHSQLRGDVPAGWKRWADEQLEPVIDWRRVLRSAVRRGVADVAGRVDFTYRRPSRRASALPDVILPSLRQPRPTVAVVVDTSGSMSDGMLAQVLGEIGGLLAGMGIARDRLSVVCCDARAFEAQRVVSAKEVLLLGGGGTDMGAGLAAAEALKPVPDLIIVLTDGHTPWPSRPPRRSRVVVGLMDPSGSVPDWAGHVLIDPTGLVAT
jgi:predicted metal-dependent peptidase